MARTRNTTVVVKRVQMDLPPRSLERLQRLQDVTEAASYAEVMRNALRLYEAMIAETEAGREIMIKSKDGLTPLHLFSA
ncbi:hypothetical protein E5675_19040 [Sphingopyxis sp. PAMC25046]|nr:hypothetical protein E5675_19040 [Sphingopyxis sp. PAMC25046]